MNSRRSFLQVVGTALLTPFLPKIPASVAAAAAPVTLVTATTGLSIAQIVAISWAGAYAAMKDGHEWADDRLNLAMDEGRLIIRPLAANISVNGKFYDIRQLNVPTTWTKGDEAKNERPEDREALCCDLIENTINAHEDQLVNSLDHHNLIVSNAYHVERGDIQQVMGQNAFYFLTYTGRGGCSKGHRPADCVH